MSGLDADQELNELLVAWLTHDEDCQCNLTDVHEDCTCITEQVRKNLLRVIGKYLKQQVTAAEGQALRQGRVTALNEYLAQCNVLRVEPSRRSLEMFQLGQQQALRDLS